MKVAAVQHDIVWEDREATLAHLDAMIDVAAAAGARLVALAEMFPAGFSMHTDRIAEDLDGPSAAFLVAKATALGVWVCGSIPTRAHPDAPSARATNTFTLAGPDGSIGRYDKMYPFSYSGEDKHYAAGASPAHFVVDDLRVTPFVCYDLRFADTWWDQAPNTDLYVCVANWPAARRTHWQTLLRARAIENQAYVLGANRVGVGNGLAYSGDSVIIDPFGEVLAEATPDVEQIVFADVDARRVAEVRAKYPFMRDRRPRSST
jgi:predicted amidohydrolase